MVRHDYPLSLAVATVFSWLLVVPAEAQPSLPITHRGPALALDHVRYRLRAGNPLTLNGSEDAIDFILSATSIKIVDGNQEHPGTFVIGPSLTGDTVLLAASHLVPPGDYSVGISAVSQEGEERHATVEVAVDAVATVPDRAVAPPVVLLNGWQFLYNSNSASIGGCPISTGPSDTFGSLAQQLKQQPTNVPVVYFFDNCVEDPNDSIEGIGNALATFLSLIRYDSGARVPQIDLVAHSMGGLIVRSYLEGLQLDGSFAPPASPPIRKFVEIATPNFGAFIATNPLASLFGTQTKELIPGSTFLWRLGSWNQRSDDLRGIDSLAIVGDAGALGGLAAASDGILSVTSGSLGFARDPSRTRILPYCHIASNAFANPTLGTMTCSGRGIANADDAPQTALIVRSFLANTQDWSSIGLTPNQEGYLSQYGGLYFLLENVNATPVADLTQVRWGNVMLQNGGAANTVYYNEFLKGTDTFQFTSKSLGTATCGSFAPPIGFYSLFLCKYGPLIRSITPTVPNVAGKFVESGTTVTINGAGFGQRCSTCGVSVSNSSLNIITWSDQTITVALPAINGLVRFAVTTASGASDFFNTMVMPLPTAVIDPVVTSVVNAASGVPGPIAPGEIITIKGNALGPTTGVSFSVDSDDRVALALGGTQVFFGSFAAPITYASATQVNAIVPYEVAGLGQVTMQVSYQGDRSAGTPLQVAAASPGAFTLNSTGSGQAIAANQDGSLNTSSNAAAAGSYVTIYFTGGGQTNPSGTTGSVNGFDLKYLVQNVSVTVGGATAAVAFAGAAPGLLDGVGQLNIQLGENTPAGSTQPLVIKVGENKSPATATLAVQAAAAPTLKSLSLNTNTVIGGNSLTGTVTLTRLQVRAFLYRSCQIIQVPRCPHP